VLGTGDGAGGTQAGQGQHASPFLGGRGAGVSHHRMPVSMFHRSIDNG
jgi:uncharacterized spore protein YtfJ